MSTSQALQRVITKVSSPLDKDALPDGEVFVIVDADSHQIVGRPKLSILRSLLSIPAASKYLYYLIRTAEDANGANAVSGKLEFTVPCKLSIEYKVWCPATFAHRLAANVAANGSLGERVDSLVRQWVVEIIQQAAENENGPKNFSRQLITWLDQRAKDEASFLNFSFAVILPEVPSEFVVDQQPAEVDLRLGGYGKTVKIKSRLRLTCKNPFRYLRAGAPPLKKWVEDEVRTIVNDKAWGESYSKFLSEFGSIKDKIRDEITFKGLYEIGYEVRQLLTRPDAPEIDLLTEFKLSDDVLECETLDAGAKVKIQVVFSGKLKSFLSPRIQALLLAEENIRTRIETEIRTSVESALRNRLHRVNHEDFHRNFWPAPNIPAPYKEELTHCVARVLAEFEVTTLSGQALEDVIVVKLGKDHVHELYEKISESLLLLETLVVKRYGGGEEVTYKVELRFLGVSEQNFSAFLRHAKSIESIKEGLHRELKTISASVPAKLLWFETERDRQALMKALTVQLNLYSSVQFGLNVEIASIERGLNLIEGANSEILQVRANAYKNISVEKIKLMEERLLSDVKTESTRLGLNASSRTEVEMDADFQSLADPTTNSPDSKLPKGRSKKQIRDSKTNNEDQTE